MTAPGFLTETRERFLKAVLAQLPLERIREVYVFPPIRQGGMESGVAVVTAWPDGASAAGRRPSGEGPEAAPGRESDVAPDEVTKTEPMDVVELAELAGDAAEENACALPAGADTVPSSTADGRQPTADGAAADGRPPTADGPRYTVYTARYRHVLKGPDRGKWEASVVAEADAPLVSIESVVRGVQRRAGDVEAPDHMTADDLRAALRLGPPASDAA